MPERWIVTGFGPFRDVVENPSSWLAQRSGLPYELLEVSFAGVDAYLDQLNPDTFDHWLMIGVHGGATKFHLECVGKNFVGPGEDVLGMVGGPGKIDPSLPPQIHTDFWADALPDETMEITTDAGGYLCNYLLTRGLQKFPDKRIGFLHVPRQEVVPLETQLEWFRRLLIQIGANLANRVEESETVV